MTVRYVDPRAEPGMPVEPYTLRADLDARPLTIGLLANGFPDSVPFLDAVGAALAEVLPGISFLRWDKGDASSVASTEVLAEMAAGCHAVVAAYGH